MSKVSDPFGSRGGGQTWDETDFELNKFFWSRWGNDSSLPFRMRNLNNVQLVLQENQISSWLYGNTLRDFIIRQSLGSDHDDDIMISFSKLQDIPESVIHQLETHGFSLIRKEPEIWSVFRDGRYLDIHPANLESHVTLESRLHGVTVWIHKDSDAILERKYPKSSRIQQALSLIVAAINLAFRPPRKLNWVEIWERKREKWKKVAIGRIAKLVRYRKTRPLSLREFLALKMDEDNSVNWSWRGSHLTKLLNQGESIGAMLERLKQNDSNLIEGIEETPLDSPVEEPLHLSRAFWKRGNNFFLYPFLYGFRHLVMPYHAANLYILAGRGPSLYSRDYFIDLTPMTDEEVRRFLSQNPIEIKRGSITSGRHRATAMAGRLHRGETYIPIHARVQR